MVRMSSTHRGRGVAIRLAWVAGLVGVFLFTTACPPPQTSAPPRVRSRLSKVRGEQPGMVRIEGIAPIAGFAKGRDSTFMHCLELILDASGTPVSYDELMGISGLAFRIQFRVGPWDVGNCDPLVGENCLPELFTALGWQYDVWVVRQGELAEADLLKRAIRRSIDAERPVLAANIIPPEDWGIITGYLADDTWLCRSYNGDAQRTDRRAQGWPSGVVILTKRVGSGNIKEAHRNSIRRAVELWDKRRHEEYALGERAFEEWCRSLRTVTTADYVHANFWTYIGLIDARASASRYLRQIAPEFGSSQQALLDAAEWYEKETRLLLSGLNVVPSARSLGGAMPPIEMRTRQIDTLRQAQTYEKNAIDKLRGVR